MPIGFINTCKRKWLGGGTIESGKKEEGLSKILGYPSNLNLNTLDVDVFFHIPRFLECLITRAL